MIKKPRPKHSMKLEDGDEIRLEKIELSSTHKTVQLIHNKSVPFKTWFYKVLMCGHVVCGHVVCGQVVILHKEY